MFRLRTPTDKYLNELADGMVKRVSEGGSSSSSGGYRTDRDFPVCFGLQQIATPQTKSDKPDGSNVYYEQQYSNYRYSYTNDAGTANVMRSSIEMCAGVCFGLQHIETPMAIYIVNNYVSQLFHDFHLIQLAGNGNASNGGWGGSHVIRGVTPFARGNRASNRVDSSFRLTGDGTHGAWNNGSGTMYADCANSYGNI